jgi:UDP-N-acetylmuramoylalanine--D-glutamate ligase
VVALENKNVLVVGLGASGKAACDLLLRKGARVWAVDDARNEALERDAEALKAKGVQVGLGGKIPAGSFDLAVVSPGVPWTSPTLKAVTGAKNPPHW